MKVHAAAVLVTCFTAAVSLGQPPRDIHCDPLPAGAFARLGMLRFQHEAEGACTALAVLPDGKKVISVQRAVRQDKATWHLWDGEGRPLFQAQTGGATVRCIAISPCGDRLALLTGPNEEKIDGDSQEAPRYAIEVWDIRTRKKLESIPLGKQRASAVLLPDRDTILTAEVVESTIQVRNVRTERIDRSWQVKGDAVERLTASADGRSLAATARNGPIRVWEAATGQLVGTLPYHGRQIQFEAEIQGWHNAGILKVANVDMGGLHLQAGKKVWQLKHGEYDPFTVAAFAPDGKTLFAATHSGAVTQWDCATGKEIAHPDRPPGGVRSLSVSPGARFVAVAHRTSPGTFSVWDTAAGKRVQEETLSDYFFDHAFAADGTFAYVNDRRLFVTPTPGKTKPREFDKPTPHQLYRLRFSPDGKMLYMTTPNGVNRWTVADGKHLPIVESFKLWSRPLEFSPDGKWLALGRNGIKIIRADAASGKEKNVLFDTHGSGAREWAMWGSLKFVSSSQLLVAQAFESEVRLLDLSSGTVRQRWQWRLEFTDRECGNSPSNSGAIAVLPHGQSAVMVPDGGRAMLLNTDNVARRSNLIRLIDLASGGIRLELDPRQGNDLHIALSPDGRYLASGGRDGTVLLWDLYARQPGPPPSFEQCWETLTGRDGPAIHGALCALVQQPERAVKFLHTKLAPARPHADPATVRKLIAALESADFRDRQSAHAQLKKLHCQVEPALRCARSKASSLEAQRRLDLLLAECEVDTPEQLRVRRALEALEMMQHPAGVRFLESLAGGGADLFPTPEAQMAVQRIGRHRLGSPLTIVK